MKVYRLGRKSFLVFLTGLSIFLLLSVTPVFASKLSLSPTSINAQTGSGFSALLRLDTQGSSINAVDISISYPKDLVDVSAVSPSSDFKTVLDKSFTDGTIHLSLASLDPDTGQITAASGNVTIADIQFQAKNSGGNASITISNQSQTVDAESSSNNLDTSQLGNAVVTITTTETSSNTTSNTTSNSTTGNTASNVDSTGSCKSKESNIKSDMQGLITTTTGLQNKITGIFKLVTDYYLIKLAPTGKKLANFDSIYSSLNSQKLTADGLLIKSKNDMNNFSCTGDPKAKLAQFKQDILDEKSTLTTFKESLRQFIGKIKQ